jgi:hypothetical protein
MNKTTIFATTSYRLSADLLIIRLKRVGISTNKISALFPSKSRPNSALCWLGKCLTSTGWRNEDMSLTVAGPLRRFFASKQFGAGIADRLEATGLAEESSRQLEEKLRQGQILVCVDAETDLEISLAWHVCYQMNADSLLVSSSYDDSAVKAPARARSSRANRPLFRTPNFGSSLLPLPAWVGASA